LLGNFYQLTPTSILRITHSHLEVLVYESIKIPDKVSALDIEDEEDKAVGLEGLEIQLIEFLSTLITNAAEITKNTEQKPLLEGDMKQLVWLLCIYAQIKKSDADQLMGKEHAAISDFIALEADDASNISLRNCSQLLIEELIRIDKVFTLILAEVIDMFISDKSKAIHAEPLPLPNFDYQSFYYESSNSLRALFKREAALYLFGWFAPNINTDIEGADKILVNTVKNYLLPELKTERKDYDNLFKYRAYSTGAQVLSVLADTEYFEGISQELLEEAYKALINPNTHLAVQMGCCKVFKEAKSTLNKIEKKEVLEQLAKQLLVVLDNASTDTRIFVLKAMNVFCKSKFVDQIYGLVGSLFEAALKTLVAANSEAEIYNEVPYFAYTVFSQSKVVVASVVPIVCKFMSNLITSYEYNEADNDLIEIAYGIFRIAIEKVFNDNKEVSPEIQNTISILIKEMMIRNDISFLLRALNVLRHYLAYAFNTITHEYFIY